MKPTNLTTMRENLSKLDAKEIYYFRWTSGSLYTVMASDGKRYGQIITIGYVKDTKLLNELDCLYTTIVPLIKSFTNS